MGKQLTIAERIATQKNALQSLANRLLHIGQQFQAAPAVQKTLAAQIAHIQENFLFVIVGEVNAGKSSFINALLGAEVTPASQAITTMDVLKITHGDAEVQERQPGERLVVRQHPAEILRQITIVDTPGTNSREQDHQRITQAFIPHCNLVVFVFQMDNIHVQSAWDFLDAIKAEWHKKVVFILTKADRYDAEEVTGYTALLRAYAEKEGIAEPIIFATSAKLAQDPKTAPDSGLEAVRDFINTRILKDAARAKLQDDVQTLTLLQSQIQQEFVTRQSNYEADRTSRDRIAARMAQKSALAAEHITQLTDQCAASYDRIAAHTASDLAQEVGFFTMTWRAVRGIFVKGGSTQEELDAIQDRHVAALQQAINETLHAGLDVLKADIQYLVMGVKEELEELRDQRHPSSQMFQTIERQRDDILQRLQRNLTQFIEQSTLFAATHRIRNEVNYSGVGVAGGIAAAGAALTFISQAAVLDITGGIATALGVLVASGMATISKSRFMRKVRHSLDEHRNALTLKLHTDLSAYVQEINDHIKRQFAEFDHHLDTEKIQIQRYTDQMQPLKAELNQLRNEVVVG